MGNLLFQHQSQPQVQKPEVEDENRNFANNAIIRCEYLKHLDYIRLHITSETQMEIDSLFIHFKRRSLAVANEHELQLRSMKAIKMNRAIRNGQTWLDMMNAFLMSKLDPSDAEMGMLSSEFGEVLEEIMNDSKLNEIFAEKY